MSLVCRSSSSLTAKAICLVLITVSSSFSSPSSSQQYQSCLNQILWSWHQLA
ncbi:hypothetical protein HanXRQr2_Chr03g0118201 [Helianthus annuus]|uniref:Uncharacterized protein n=1 Tax=Helianthus annuus TaxID=4232 RepID=A0A9K3NVQ2_HELAN|nr:hypothetical protein HanXRQr2_Chr03g0118201 [Helianthus annuus]KAJ0944287.1 hypothetical protein HanPSC8_Chr03g0114831 [Helianthus annuus]